MASNGIEIAIVGSCNVDHITYTTRFPVAGETLNGHLYVTGLGGKGANQCVAARKLGAKTAMVGKVGFDSDGDSYFQKFTSLGINTEYLLRTDESATGIASITVNDSGNNTIVIVSGANLKLEPLDVAAALKIIQEAKVIVCQNEIPVEVTLEALKSAKKCDKFTIFNPAPAPLQDLCLDFYKFSDIICCNETESFALTDINVQSVEDAKNAAQKLVQKGCKIGIVTLGEKGCVYFETNGTDPVHVKAEKVNAVDTTGAGDSFVGALAYFHVTFPNISLFEKIKRANCVAASSVCKEGTQSSYPSRTDLPYCLFKS